MTFKRYQIAILSFAFGIFAVTSLLIFLTNQREEPVKEPEREYSSIFIFFSDRVKDPKSLYCDMTYPVERAVSRMSNNKKSELGELAYLALMELLKGPAGYEIDNGYFTSISDEAQVQRIAIESGVAYVDFSAIGGDFIGGSCKTQAVRAQIEETLKQFPEIKEVVISVDGETEEILQP